MMTELGNKVEIGATPGWIARRSLCLGNGVVHVASTRVGSLLQTAVKYRNSYLSGPKVTTAQA